MSGASQALGSKPDTATSALLLPAGVFLLILTFLPFVYILPYYVNMILQVSFASLFFACKDASVLRLLYGMALPFYARASAIRAVALSGREERMQPKMAHAVSALCKLA